MMADINSVFGEQMVDPQAIGTELLQRECKRRGEEEERENMR